MPQTTIKVRHFNTRRTADKYAHMLELTGHWTEVKPAPQKGFVLTFFRRTQS